MDWPRKKETFFNNLRSRIRSLSSKRNNSYLTVNSHLRIPILINKINITQASTQTLPIQFNNNAKETQRNIDARQKSRRRKYQRHFNKCLAELVEKYPPIPEHEYLKDYKLIHDDEPDENYLSAISIFNDFDSSVWSKLIESRDDLSKLNKTLEDLDRRLECLSTSICENCKHVN